MRFLAAALGLLLGSLLPLEARAEQTISRAEWMEGMKTGLPVVFCQEASYFRECFQISAEECEGTALSATRVCLTRFESEIPSVLHLPQEGQAWGQKVGSCAGTSFEVTWTEKKLDSAKCSDPSAWGLGTQPTRPRGSH